MKKIFFLTIISTCFLCSCVSKKLYKTALEKSKREQQLTDSLLSTIKSFQIDYISLNEDFLKSSHNLTDSLYRLNTELQHVKYEAIRAEKLNMQLKDGLTQQQQEIAETQAEYNMLKSYMEEQKSILMRHKKVIDEVFEELPSNIDVKQVGNRLNLVFPQDILFDPGQAILKDETKNILKLLGEKFSNERVNFIVTGHTDNQPVNPTASRFEDNDELSFVRAKAVGEILHAENIQWDKIKLIGAGEHFPVASNESAEGKAKNRRTEISIAIDDTPFQQSLFEIINAEPTQAKVVTNPEGLEKYLINETNWILNLYKKTYEEQVAICRENPEWKINSGNNFFNLTTRTYYILVIKDDQLVAVKTIHPQKDKDENIITITHNLE